MTVKTASIATMDRLLFEAGFSSIQMPGAGKSGPKAWFLPIRVTERDGRVSHLFFFGTSGTLRSAVVEESALDSRMLANIPKLYKATISYFTHSTATAKAQQGEFGTCRIMEVRKKSGHKIPRYIEETVPESSIAQLRHAEDHGFRPVSIAGQERRDIHPELMVKRLQELSSMAVAPAASPSSRSAIDTPVYGDVPAAAVQQMLRNLAR